MSKSLFFMIFLISFSFFFVPCHAAFDEQIISGQILNMTEDSILVQISYSSHAGYENQSQIPIPKELIKHLDVGDEIIYGSPEPLLVVRDSQIISYAYGNIFDTSDVLELSNGVILSLENHKELSGSSSDNSYMVDVRTDIIIRRGSESKEISLDPKEYTEIYDTIIGVHRAELPGEPIEGPQHWYVYEVCTNPGEFDAGDLVYVKPQKKNDFTILIYILIAVFLIFISKKIKQSSSK